VPATLQKDDVNGLGEVVRLGEGTHAFHKGKESR
jgi:hypothetical protein